MNKKVRYHKTRFLQNDGGRGGPGGDGGFCFCHENAEDKRHGLIFMVGDGMPLGVIRAMHELRIRTQGEKGTNFYNRLSDPGSIIGSMGTKSLSSIVTDSAPASVAWATGSKTVNRMLSSLPDGRPLRTIAEILKDVGIAAGFVTTTRVTHATPAAWYSHDSNRDNEDSIALEALDLEVDVLLGGGSRHFDPARRKDRRDLFKEFKDSGYDVVRSKAEVLSDRVLFTDRPLFGAFVSSHMAYDVDRLNDKKLGDSQPTLAEMKRVALTKPSRNQRGFLLQIEAGRIDRANHANEAWAATKNVYEFDVTSLSNFTLSI